PSEKRPPWAGRALAGCLRHPAGSVEPLRFGEGTGLRHITDSTQGTPPRPLRRRREATRRMASSPPPMTLFLTALLRPLHPQPESDLAQHPVEGLHLGAGQPQPAPHVAQVGLHR